MTARTPYSSYKPSGIDWLGDIPAHWETAQLHRMAKETKSSNRDMVETQVLSLSYGRIIVKNPDKKGLMPENFGTYQVVNPGNIILRLTDLQNDHTSLRVGLARDRGIITSAYVCLEPSDQVESRYAYRLLHSFDEGKHLYGMGSGVRQGLSYKELRREPFPLPPLHEQRAIADFLDRKDAEITRFIESRRRMIALMEEKKQATINQAVTKGLDPSVPMKDSGIEWLGEIPAHWEVRPLKRLAEVSPSIPLDRNTEQRQRVPFLPMESLGTDGTMSFDQLRPIVDVASGFPRFQPDDFLLAKITPCFENGKSGLVPRMPGPVGFGSTEYHVIRFNTSQIRLEFASHILRSKWFRSVGEEHMTGSAGQKRVPTDFLKSFMFPLPPLEDQYDIANHLNRIAQLVEQQKSRMEREIALMQEYRTRLISDVVTGKVKVG